MLKLPHRPWSDSAESILHDLNADPKQGLSDQEVRSRVKTFGQNIFESSKEVSPITIFFRQFLSPLIIILCIAVVLTSALSEWVDAIIIGFAVLVNAILGFIQEYKAERAIAELHSYITHRTRVIRNGKEVEVDPHLLVPGDILHIANGARITADARIVKEINFTADESILTGESLPIEKITEPLSETTALPDRTNMVFAGTLGVDGSAYAVVTATGHNTEIGKLAKLVAETQSDQTPLQKALSKLTWVIIAFTLILVSGIFVIGLLEEQPLIEMLLLSIAVLVGSVPEALPIGLTAILAIGVERIAKRKGIMRSLTAAETLGSTTLIITDKTGTLTEADMKLKDIDTTEIMLSDDFKPSDSSEHFNREQNEILNLARTACDVSIENPEDDPEEWVLSGNDLEMNIVRSAGRRGIVETPADRANIQIRIPFSSRYKYSVTRIPTKYLPDNLSEFADPHVVMGAPDILIQKSYLSEKNRSRLLEAIKAHSEYGRRVLGIALLTPHADPTSITTEHVKDLTFVGVLSFYDPVREEVPEALKKIKSYGVKVIMATGDLPGTAKSVANELGWQIDDSNILTGEQLSQLSDNDLNEILDRIHIYARVTPEDKLRVTRLHQAKKEVVAMTGDGVNDSPSLKAANIGIAVGSGSDVAKSVADLILLDDNFKTIVATIEEGKQILSNIKKMFVYLVSNTLDELILIGGAILAGVALPLNALQIIWVNLFTGSLPAIAYAFDRQLMKESEASSRQFFDRRVIFLTISVGVIISFMLLGLYLELLYLGVTVEVARSVLFACFGTYTLIISYSFLDLSRPIYSYSLIKNKVLTAGVSIGLVLMAVTIYTPFFQNLFDTAPLTLPWLGFVCLWLVVTVIVVEIAKWFANTFLVKAD